MIVLLSYNFTMSNAGSMLGQNQRLLRVKLGWEQNSTTEYTWLFNIGGFGTILGSIIGSHVVGYGRRNAFFVISTLFFTSAALVQIMNYWTFFFSFFILGLNGGIMACTGGRMIEEYVPLAMFSLAF
jgi:MFS family permease